MIDVPLLRFIYIDYGGKPSIAMELKYSLDTLLAEDVDPAQIAIYTDRPLVYTDTIYNIVDISSRLATYFGATKYSHRTKLAIILDDLRASGEGCAVVLLDTDSFVRAGFLHEVRMALDNVGMNFLVRRDPYRGFGPFEVALPSGRHYKYSKDASIMYNSGIVAVRRKHIPIIIDAIAMVDALLEVNLHEHDIEQFALTEAFRIHNIRIESINKSYQHYCMHWWKRYMHWRLGKLKERPFAEPHSRRPDIWINKTIVRLFKGAIISYAVLTGRYSRLKGKKGRIKIIPNF
jgi:hypothetical protein